MVDDSTITATGSAATADTGTSGSGPEVGAGDQSQSGGVAGTTGTDATGYADLTDEQLLGIDEVPGGVPGADPQPTTQEQLGKPQTGQTGQDRPEQGQEEPILPTGAAPPDWLKALYNHADPNIGRQARALWDQTAAYRGVFPSVAEAKQVREIVDQQGGLEELREMVTAGQRSQETDQNFFSGDPERQAPIIAEMFREDPEAFESGIHVSLDVIRQSDPERFQRLADRVIGDNLKADRFDQHVDWLAELVAGEEIKAKAPELVDAVRTLVGWADKRGLGGQRQQQRADLDPQRQQLEARARELDQRENSTRVQQFEGLRGGVQEAVTSGLRTEVSQVLSTLIPKVSEGIRDRIAQQVLDEIDRAMQGEGRIQQQFLAMVHPSKTQWRFDRGTQDQLIKLVLGRGKQLLNSTTKKVVEEWTGGVLKSNKITTMKANAQAARPDIAGGAPVGAGAKPRVTQEQANKMSNEEILNS